MELNSNADFIDQLIKRATDFKHALGAYNGIDIDDDVLLELYKKNFSGSISLLNIRRAEEILGFQLPPLFRQIYLTVNNGGFGPNYGLMKLLPTNEDSSIVGNYLSLRTVTKPELEWPEKMLPICDHGCAIYSCVDCSKPDAPVFLYDSNMDEDEDGTSLGLIFKLEAINFKEWLEKWLNS